MLESQRDMMALQRAIDISLFFVQYKGFMMWKKIVTISLVLLSFLPGLIHGGITDSKNEIPKELPLSEMFPPANGKLPPLAGEIKNGRYFSPGNIFSCQADDFGEGIPRVIQESGNGKEAP